MNEDKWPLVRMNLSRCKITHLPLPFLSQEFENFKSYAGVKEIGPFHKCFSSIVGPNGSGKSNVIDGLLFVFGNRASKLRLKKVSELIHKSDAVSANPPTSARVSVYFQEIRDPVKETPGIDEDYEVVSGSETVVSRIARKDNSSTYRLNGKNCQKKDVELYLGSMGISLDNNRFLILQGEVEMISMMPPKGKNEEEGGGLLEYLEEIIGSKKFVKETEKAAALVDELTEQRQEKLNRVKAVEKEKDSLEGAKQEAEALVKKNIEIRRKHNILYQIHSMKATTELEKLAGKKAVAEEQLEKERERLGSADSRVKELESSLKEQQKEYNKIHKELEETTAEFSAYERRDIKLREQIKHCKQQKKKLETKVKTQTAKEEECQQKAVEAEESIPELEEEIVTLTVAKDENDAALELIHEQMKGVTQKLRSELETKTQELAPVNQERAVFQADLDTAATEVKLLEDGVTRAKEKLVSAESELAAIDQKQESKRQELASSEDELTAATDRIAEAEKEEKVMAENETKLSQRYTQLMAQAEEAKAEIQSKGTTKSSPTLKALLQAARKGGELEGAGVLGRLGDLATIPDEYDVAVSTAAAGSLDNIVVNSTAGAQKCIKFLRKHNLGRAQFIPLDKMKKGAHDIAVETPENAPRLLDLIQPKRPFLAPAIYLAVHQTLVAPDMETATRWAYDYGKRWRVVTLDGKLIEASGTMSGGGKSVRRGGMKLSSGSKAAMTDDGDETADCETLEKEAVTAQQLLQECRTGRKTLMDEIRALKKRVKVLETKLPKLSVEIDACDTTRDELTKFIPELRTQCELSDEDAATLVELKEKVSKCKTDMASCALKASKLEAEVARLQKAIMEAGGSKLKKQQAACEKALSNLNAAEKALSQARVSITSMNKAATKAQKGKIDAEKELEQCLAKSEELKTEFKALEADAFTVMKSFESVKETEAEAREKLEEASKEMDGLKKSQADVKCIEVELMGKIDELDKQISEWERRQDKCESDLTKLRAAAKEEEDFDFSDEEEEEEEDNENKSVDSSPKEDGQDATEDVEMEDASDAGSKGGDDAETASPKSKQKKTQSGLPVFSREALQRYSKDEIMESIATLENERNTLAKNANMSAIADYKKKKQAYESRYVSCRYFLFLGLPKQLTLFLVPL